MLKGLLKARKVVILAVAAFVSQAGVALAIDGVRLPSPAEKRGVVYLPRDLFESAAYRDFVADVGVPRDFAWNLDNGTVRRFVGSVPFVTPSGTGDRAEIEAAVRSLIDRHPALFGATSEAFTLDRGGYIQQPHRIAYVWMEQNYKGLPVYGSGLSFSIHTPSGNLMKFFAHDVVADPDVDVAPAFTPADGTNLAYQHVRAFPGFRFVHAEELATLQVISTRDGTGRAVYSTYVASGFAEEPGRWLVHVDARTGEVIRVDDLVRYVDVSGNVKGRAQEFDPASALATLDLPEMRVRIVGGATVFTDANGNFTIPNAGAGAVTVEAALVGRWVTVNNSSGTTELLTQIVTPPGPANFTFNLSGSEQTTSQANAALHQTRIHNFIAGRVGPSAIDTAFRANVNVNTGTCNAFYNGSSTNYYLAGGNCRNTAYDTVIYHEYGHFVDDRFGGILDGGLSEGWGDTVAMYLTGQPLTGENFFTSGGFIRTGENTRTWPAPECGGEVHCVGEVWMGYAWKVRVSLIATHGSAMGAEIANQDIIDIIPANSNSIPDAVIDSFIADDDDGDLDNGTPNYSDLSAAAICKNLPFPEVTIVGLSHTPLADTRRTAADYAVTANATSTEAAISSVVLTYRVGGGADQNVGLTPAGGGNYTGVIPAQFCNRDVEYYIRATDANSNTATLPKGAPGSRYRFLVGDLVEIYFNNFENAGDEGWTHAQVATQDDWHHKDPNPFGTQPNDPPTAFSGTRCWGNDLQPTTMWNGNYMNFVNNYLESPVINSAGFDTLTFSYRRWLTVEDGFYDTARILVNGTEVWRNPIGSGTDHFFDTSWQLHEIALPPAATTQIRFELVSDAGLNFGGWTIDDVRIHALTCVATLDFSDLAPSIGEQISIDIGAGPDENYFLLLSRNTGSAPYTPPGGPTVTTQLGTPFRAKKTGILDPSGNVRITGNVPNRASLIGRTLHFQAVDGAGRISERATVVLQP